ncbi:Metallo-dependent phosphatase-like protein [Morchella snyderi]|nr:Metallo-dependent phosphatase-like protein [Morchella snyderi]
MKDTPPSPPPPTGTSTSIPNPPPPPPPYPTDTKHSYPHPPPSTLAPADSSASWRYYLTSLAASLFLLYLVLPPTVTNTVSGLLPPSAAEPYFAADRFLASRLGYRLVADVPLALVPGRKGVKRGGEGHGRVIIVGDVHGMFHELVKLLEKTNYDPENDYLVFSGDMISKGPDSLKVLDLARSYSAGCVRGNHEDRVLLHWHDLQKKKRNGRKSGHHSGKHPRTTAAASIDDLELEPAEEEEETVEVADDDADDEFTTQRIRNERKLAKSLSRKQAAWLDACPLVLRMKQVADLGQVDVVHAGLVHGVHLEDQDPKAIMNMRSLDKKRLTPLPEGEKDGVHWADVWNRGEREQEKEGGGEARTTVVYGHYAAKGLDIRKYSKGLDSNCVRGGRLSAFVIGRKKEELVSVSCRTFLKD